MPLLYIYICICKFKPPSCVCVCRPVWCLNSERLIVKCVVGPVIPWCISAYKMHYQTVIDTSRLVCFTRQYRPISFKRLWFLLLEYFNMALYRILPESPYEVCSQCPWSSKTSQRGKCLTQYSTGQFLRWKNTRYKIFVPRIKNLYNCMQVQASNKLLLYIYRQINVHCMWYIDQINWWGLYSKYHKCIF